MFPEFFTTQLLSIDDKKGRALSVQELRSLRISIIHFLQGWPEAPECILSEETTLPEKVINYIIRHIFFSRWTTHHTWSEITYNVYIRNHDPNGDTLYVADICISPAYRKLGLGKWLMQSMYEVVGLRRLLGGVRIPGYHRVAHQMTATQYLEAIVRGELKDPVITFLLHCGRVSVALVPNYLDDEESHHYGVLMEWRNLFLRQENRPRCCSFFPKFLVSPSKRRLFHL